MQTATIKATGQKVTIIDFKEETICYPKKTVVVSVFYVKDLQGASVRNEPKGGYTFTSDELEIEPPTPKPTKDEILFREIQDENQEISEDYNIAAFDANYK